MAKKRAQWASHIGFVLAAAGSAVGLGNIWKFPGKAYNGGGGAWLLIYVLIVVFIGMIAMLAEFTVGRKTQKNAVGAFQELKKPKWSWVGGLGVLTGFIIICYYGQVGGWVMKYIFAYIVEPAKVLANPEGYFYAVLGALGPDPAAAFGGFPLEGAIIWPLIFFGIAVVILLRGVVEGIEKFNKFAMPALFAILIILLVRSVTLPGAGEGIRYLLTIDFTKITGEGVLAALGQAFFSLSLGMGIMITYGSYLSREENLVRSAAIICALDTSVALIAGFVIIPAVFASGITPGMGGGFAFISLAAVFESMPFGAFFGTLFYLLLFFAAITSMISILEGTIAYASEEFHWERKKTTLLISGVCFVIGMLYTLGQGYLPLKGIWFDFANGVTFPGFGDFMEYLTDRLLMPLGALMFCIFVGYIWGPENAIEEIEQGGRFKVAIYKRAYPALVKFVAPAAIALILIWAFAFGIAL